MDNNINTETQFLGELPALLVHKHAKRPERRQVSKRWLASSVLVGVTSFFLMGGALFAALEGRQQLTLPAQTYNKATLEQVTGNQALKGNHPSLFAKLQKAEPSNVIMASTSTRQGEQIIVKAKPFMKIKASMAIANRPAQKYPTFYALNVFSESGKAQAIAKSSDFIYGAEVESEVALSISDFPYQDVGRKFKPRQNSNDIRKQVRFFVANFDSIADENNVSAISDLEQDKFPTANNLNQDKADVTITAENVSVLGKVDYGTYSGIWYEDRLIEVRANASITQILEGEGLANDEIFKIVEALSSDLGTDVLKKGDTLQAYFQNETLSNGEKQKTLARVSIFRGATHLVSIAKPDKSTIEGDLNSELKFVYAIEPESPEEIFEETKEQPILAASKLPSTYDAIYRTALNEGLTPKLAGSLIKIMAFDVDFKSRISPTDSLEVFLSLEDGKEVATTESEILYAAIKLGKVTRKYYRFGDTKSGVIDYYDETGKSSKKFLLRKPVPNGKFRSAYGMRRHPISRRLKLHGGVDWSAPRGTPIVAAGNGVVKKAGWGSGYGKQTIITHANGYESSYSHQTAYAKGIRSGARVRQGQVIGYVGSTGYSTGPHLHYEVKVNGNRVDPMRIRLPKGKVLKGGELNTFLAAKERLDELINPSSSELALN